MLIRLGFNICTLSEKNCSRNGLYEVPGIRISKTITMVYGENTTIIRYEILQATEPFTMEFLPLIAAQGLSSVAKSPQGIFSGKWNLKMEFFIISPMKMRRIFLFCSRIGLPTSKSMV